MASKRPQSDRLQFPLNPAQVEALDSMLATLFKRVRDLELSLASATATSTTTTGSGVSSGSALASVMHRDGDDGDQGPMGPPGIMGLTGPAGLGIPGQDGEDAVEWRQGFNGLNPLSGSKIYFVADSSGGAVTRKLTFVDGVLILET